MNINLETVEFALEWHGQYSGLLHSFISTLFQFRNALPLKNVNNGSSTGLCDHVISWYAVRPTECIHCTRQTIKIP